MLPHIVLQAYLTVPPPVVPLKFAPYIWQEHIRITDLRNTHRRGGDQDRNPPLTGFAPFGLGDRHRIPPFPPAHLDKVEDIRVAVEVAVYDGVSAVGGGRAVGKLVFGSEAVVEFGFDLEGPLFLLALRFVEGGGAVDAGVGTVGEDAVGGVEGYSFGAAGFGGGRGGVAEAEEVFFGFTTFGHAQRCNVNFFIGL